MSVKKNVPITAMKLGAASFALMFGNSQIVIGNSTLNISEQTITSSRLIPRYPKDSVCPALTSLFGAATDSKLNGKNSGVEGGRQGDVVLAPADGMVLAVWKTKSDHILKVLIQHVASELNLPDDQSTYLSEFSHLNFGTIEQLRKNQLIKRGQPIGIVSSQNNHSTPSSKVHWKVYKILPNSSSEIQWSKNEYGDDIWTHDKAQLVDPLHMLSLHQGETHAKEARILPFFADEDYSEIKGFSYIFECKKPPQHN